MKSEKSRQTQAIFKRKVNIRCELNVYVRKSEDSTHISRCNQDYELNSVRISVRVERWKRKKRENTFATSYDRRTLFFLNSFSFSPCAIYLLFWSVKKSCYWVKSQMVTITRETRVTLSFFSASIYSCSRHNHLPKIEYCIGEQLTLLIILYLDLKNKTIDH